MDKYLELMNKAKVLIEGYQIKLIKKQRKLHDLELEDQQNAENLKINEEDIATARENIKNHQYSKYMVEHPIECSFCNRFAIISIIDLIFLLVSLLCFTESKSIISFFPVITSIITGMISGISSAIRDYKESKTYLLNHTMELLKSDLNLAKKKKLELLHEKNRIEITKAGCEIEIADLQKLLLDETKQLSKIEKLRIRAIEKILENKLEPQLNESFNENLEMQLLLKQRKIKLDAH